MDKFLSRSSSNPNLANKRAREDEVSPDKWRRPKKLVATPTSSSKNTETLTDNRFKGLPVDDVDLVPDPFHHASKKKMVNQTPPVIIEIGGNWTHQNIRDVVDKHCKDYHMQHRGSKLVRVQCYSAKNHQLLKDGLASEKVSFHTYTRKDEKLPKAVIKGLPKFVHANIPDELKSLGFVGASVSELRTLLPSECPPVLVQLPSGTDMMKFKKIRYLSNCVIEIQRYKPSKKQGTQCFRCQGFGHAARNCNRPPRCVKCAQDHPTWECTKNKDRQEPARCCNCQQDHPANYAQCNERLKYINRIETRRETLRKAMVSKTARAKMSAPNTWAHITKFGTNKQTHDHQLITSANHNIDIPERSSNPPPTSIPLIRTGQLQLPPCTGATTGKTTQDLETMEMLEILSTLQSIKQEFIKCKTFMEKVILILTHLGHYV